ncbi:hypothetical protein Dimus_014117 [Dionaea muscipula]
MSNSGATTEAPATEKQATEIPPAATEEQQKPREDAEKPVEDEKKKRLKQKAPPIPKEKKPRQSKPASHPPYFQMIKEAIMALDEKSGSSTYAIARYMEDKHKSELPVNFRKILGLQLKNSASRGKLIKIKASYKLSEAGKKEKGTTTKAARANAGKPKEEKKAEPKAKATAKLPKVGVRRTRKSAPAKPKQPKSIKYPTAKKAKKAGA